MVIANLNNASNTKISSALDLPDDPSLPYIATALRPVIFIEASSKKYDPIPHKGKERHDGVDIVPVTPFDLFHGISVEFGLNA
jgi:hypothetical protein